MKTRSSNRGEPRRLGNIYGAPHSHALLRHISLIRRTVRSNLLIFLACALSELPVEGTRYRTGGRGGDGDQPQGGGCQ
jgi:hypothetical protein